MSFLPGLCSEMPITLCRLFLGTLPSKAVENRLLADSLPVHYWLTSRKRVKEHANEYLELDLASCDSELMLRYCSIPFIRRHIFSELVDRQLSLMETGKAISMPDSRLMGCLEECMTLASPRLEIEMEQLQQSASSSLISGQSENSSVNVANRKSFHKERQKQPVESCDLLYLMRKCERSSSVLNSFLSRTENEMDVRVAQDAEMQARAFLCKSKIEKSFLNLVPFFSSENFLAAVQRDREKTTTQPTTSSSPPVLPLEKKEHKLFQRQYPKDALRTGGAEKMRPSDVTAYYRFMGERLLSTPVEREGEGKNKKSPLSSASFFHQALVGNALQKIATHPTYLESISMYWAKEIGLDPMSSLTSMPTPLAEVVCGQQQMFPALKLQSQFQYTSPDIARRRWRIDSVIPLMRLFPLLGNAMALEMAASLAMEAIWSSVRIPEKGRNPTEETRLRELKKRMDSTVETFEHRPDEIFSLVLDGVRIRCPPPSSSISTSLPSSSVVSEDAGATKVAS